MHGNTLETGLEGGLVVTPIKNLACNHVACNNVLLASRNELITEAWALKRRSPHPPQATDCNNVLCNF